MTTLTYIVSLDSFGIDDDAECVVEVIVSDYRPATMYRSNGDPGDPAEGGEVEILSVTCAEYPQLCDELAVILQEDEDFHDEAFVAAMEEFGDY